MTSSESVSLDSELQLGAHVLDRAAVSVAKVQLELKDEASVYDLPDSVRGWLSHVLGRPGG